MSVSGTSDFSMTAGEIIKDAMATIGATEANDVVNADDSAFCLRRLNMLAKHMAMSANLWVTTDVTVTLTPGTESYTVGDGLEVDTLRPLRLLSARREDSNGTQINVDVVSRQEYMDLPVKSTQAPANQAYYDPQRDNGVLYVWPTGTTNNTTLICTFKRPIQNFDANSNNPDFPQEWYMALVYALAVKIAPTYIGAVPQDIKMESEQLLAGLYVFDDETTSLKLRPDMR